MSPDPGDYRHHRGGENNAERDTLDIVTGYGDRDGGRGSRITTRLHVDEYRRIPLNETTEKLLDIQTTPQTKITERTARELRERATRWRARCRPLKSGDLACPPPGPAPKIP